MAYTSEVTLLVSVSPVPKAALMISVESMRPTTMSEVWALRRGMLRMPILNMTGFRTAMRATNPRMSTAAAMQPAAI